ncbi:hypothetical protein PsYK624_061910 [Phanerochaete sordida]|uniref:Uncharacterized protein n=1 Tax=Phanerochaete sordida TaxID=48140 RepID=A0A9P3G855_9APHY|nr:hypothetical protein PsYK624_061910 [Phanerochaete sordida]
MRSCGHEADPSDCSCARCCDLLARHRVILYLRAEGCRSGGNIAARPDSARRLLLLRTPAQPGRRSRP